MASLDIFNSDAFSLNNLTAAANRLPFVPGQVGALGVFESEGVSTTTVMVEQRDGQLALVDDTPRGGPGETIDHEKAELRALTVAHFQRDDAVYADEVQNVRAFGSETELETIESLVNRKAARHFRDFDMTIEHLRVGALKGIVASKSRTLVNLFTLFDVTAPADITWTLSSDTFKPRTAATDLSLAIEDELDAVNYSGIHVLCGAGFWKGLIDHKAVRETYLGYQAASELRGEMSDIFTFGGITWERYRTGRKAKAANSNADFIGDTEGRVVVKGVPGLYLERYAPADYMETVNSVGLPRYTRQTDPQNGKSRKIEVQTNPIMFCTQPKVLRRLVMA